MILKHFYRSLLTPRETEAYDCIVSALEHHHSEICYPSAEDIFRPLSAVNYDHPEFYYVNWVETMKVSRRCGCIVWQPPYLYTPAECRDIEERLSALVGDIPGISTVGKVNEIHDWFVRHIAYDREGLRQPIRSPAMFNATGPLLHRTAVCEGVSKLACLLMRQRGLDAYMVIGRAEDGGLHAWNGVMIGDHVEYSDFTYDIGLSREGHISRRYLLLSEGEMAKDHITMFI